MSEKIEANQVFPDLEVPRLGGGTLRLGRPAPGHDWTLVVVYRGKHCPICTRYLRQLEEVRPALSELGIDVAAVSADSRARAADHLSQINPSFDIGYDLSVEQMQQLGLYVSSPRLGIDAERPFAEPGLFVINDEGNVQIIDISNVPFARPDLNALSRGLKFLRGLDGDFPVNGSYTDRKGA